MKLPSHGILILSKLNRTERKKKNQKEGIEENKSTT
jgi:hypothetical protein